MSNLDSNLKVVLGRKHQGHPKCEETWHSNRRMDTMGCLLLNDRIPERDLET